MVPTRTRGHGSLCEVRDGWLFAPSSVAAAWSSSVLRVGVVVILANAA